MKLFGKVLSVIIVALGWIFVGIRFVLDAIGYATVPEDAAVAQQRLDGFFTWLVTLPWWSVWGFAVISTTALIVYAWRKDARPSKAEPANDREAHLQRIAERMAYVSDDLTLALTGTFSPRNSTFGEIVSVYLSLDKLGIATPTQWDRSEVTGRDQFDAYANAKAFLDAIRPMIRDRHLKEARAEAPRIIAAIGAKAATPTRRWPLSIGRGKQP